MNQQQKVVVLVGGSVAVIFIGIAFYLLSKKHDYDVDDEERDDEDIKSDQKELPDLNTSIASAAQSMVEMLVPKKIVGSIIGKNGSNIKQLKNEFAVRLDFDKDSDDEVLERKLVIRGEREKVLACEKKIKEIVANAPKYVDLEMFIPQEACGHVIGKGGQNIREICDVSGAKVKVDNSSSLGSLKRVTISGITTQVDTAKLLVQEKVDLHNLLREKDRLKASVKVLESTTQPTKQFKTIDLPDTQEFFQVFVSSFGTPDHIWIQLVNEEGLKLDALNKELTETYGKMDVGEEQLTIGNIGSLCIAPFEHDDQWYRASIKSIHPDRTADVYYIDFGNVARVNLDSLKKIRESYQELPAHAVECYLPITPEGPFWSKEGESLFQEVSKCANWIPLNARVIGNKAVDGFSYPVLELIDNHSKDLNVCGQLVERGEANWDEDYAGYLTRLDTVPEVEIKGKEEQDKDKEKKEEMAIPSLDLLTTPVNKESKPDVFTEEEVQVLSEQVVQSGLDEAFLDNLSEGKQTLDNKTERKTQVSEESVFVSLQDVNRTSADQTHESEDSGIVRDPSNESQVIEEDTSKEQKPNIGIIMRSQTSSHSTPTPEEYVTDNVTFEEDDQKLSSLPETKNEMHHVPSIDSVGKQPSTDDSFVDIDVETVDGTVKAVVQESVVEVVEVEEKNSPEKEVLVESSIGSQSSELNRTLIEDDSMENESELQRSLDETSRKNVLLNSSMELARENLFFVESSDTTDSDSFYSVRSDVTLTDTDNASFMTATDRLTPTNDLSVSIPDLSSSSPYSSKTELSKNPSKTIHGASSGSKFEIQFIDEATHKVVSRESLTTSFENKQKRLSASLSPGKETTV